MGFCQQNGSRSAYGAVLLSSREAIDHAVSSKVNVEPFDLSKIVNLSVDDSMMQTTILKIPSFDYLAIVKGQ